MTTTQHHAAHLARGRPDTWDRVTTGSRLLSAKGPLEGPVPFEASCVSSTVGSVKDSEGGPVSGLPRVGGGCRAAMASGAKRGVAMVLWAAVGGTTCREMSAWLLSRVGKRRPGGWGCLQTICG